MELSRAALGRYDAALATLEGRAGDYARQRVAAYLERFPGAPVADVREFAKEVVAQAVGAYGDAASTAAADLYDELAEAAGVRTQPAAIDASDPAEHIDKEVRFQAGKLVDGRAAEFAERMAALASDQVARKANQTMRANAERDGLRYARVPLGIETCDFCIMLASRGFVYRSAKSAGEGNHYHPGCRCKVIPGFGDDFTVEGYSGEQYTALQRANREIDADGTLSYTEKQRAKRAVQEYNALEYTDRYQSSGIAGKMKQSNSRKRLKRIAPVLVRQDTAEGVMRWMDREATGYNSNSVRSMAIGYALDSGHTDWIPQLQDYISSSEKNWAQRAAVPLARKSDPDSAESGKPVNESLYNSQKNYVERHGGLVLRGGEGVTRHLDSLNVRASHIGDMILLREDATTSDVLEEVYHFQQQERGDYTDLGGEEMRLRREIDAQNYLLSVTERYGIPAEEVELTKKNLKDYEEELRRRLDDRGSR